MNMFDYEFAPENDREKWLGSFSIMSGLRYFGGKSVIGKYLANRILNMAVQMKRDGKAAGIFVDAFAGGGKIALSMPEGWFDRIVLNDLDYGVYSFFKCCMERPRDLVVMIEETGGLMSESMFHFIAAHRNDKGMDPLVSASMTYWVTQASFSGATDPEKASYRYSIKDNKSEVPSSAYEKNEIEKAVRHAKKHIRNVHDRMVNLNIVLEHLDYRELIKKYNGKKYADASGEMKINSDLAGYNKLWYFDPPYHPATLSSGQEAPYESTFTLELSREMVSILHGNHKEEYGELPYFIKSDYNPKYIYEQLAAQLKDEREKLKKLKNKRGADDEKKEEKCRERIDKIEKQLRIVRICYDDFDVLENNVPRDGHEANTRNPVFYMECLGEFDKGTDSDDGKKLKGMEYVWCRGNYIPGQEKIGFDVPESLFQTSSDMANKNGNKIKEGAGQEEVSALK